MAADDDERCDALQNELEGMRSPAQVRSLGEAQRQALLALGVHKTKGWNWGEVPLAEFDHVVVEGGLVTEVNFGRTDADQPDVVFDLHQLEPLQPSLRKIDLSRCGNVTGRRCD